MSSDSFRFIQCTQFTRMSIERPDIACILICAKKVHNEAAEAGMGDAQRRYELSLVSNFTIMEF